MAKRFLPILNFSRINGISGRLWCRSKSKSFFGKTRSRTVDGHYFLAWPEMVRCGSLCFEHANPKRKGPQMTSEEGTTKTDINCFWLFRKLLFIILHLLERNMKAELVPVLSSEVCRMLSESRDSAILMQKTFLEMALSSSLPGKQDPSRGHPFTSVD